MSTAPRLVGSLLLASLTLGLTACGDDGTSDKNADETSDAAELEDAGSEADASKGDSSHDAAGSGNDGSTGSTGGDGDDGSSSFDDGVLDGMNGASGTVNGMTYTFAEHVSWWNKGDGTGNFSAYKGLIENWEIYGIPTTPGSYSCNTDGMVHRIRLIMGSKYYSTSSGGSCTLEVVKATDDTIEGRFTAELWDQVVPDALFGTVTDGVFRKAP